MQRSVTALVSLSSRRSLSTERQTPGSSTAASPPGGTKPPLPSPPLTPPPQSGATSTSSQNAPPPHRRGFLRRTAPLAVIVGAGYITYKVSTDNEFRATVKKSVPGAESVLQYIPSFSSSTPSQKGEAKQSAGSEPARKVLLKIEESKHRIGEADIASMPRDDIHGIPMRGDVDLESLTPAQRAAVRGQIVDVGDDKNMPAGEFPSDGAETDVKPADPERVADIEALGNESIEDGAVANKNEPASSVATSSETDVAEGSGKIVADTALLDAVAQVATSTEIDESKDLDLKHASEDSRDVITGKSKLARLLGKGDFNPDNMQVNEVVDDSSFEKPKIWKLNEPAISASKDDNEAIGSEVKPSPDPQSPYSKQPETPPAPKSTDSSSASANREESVESSNSPGSSTISGLFRRREQGETDSGTRPSLTAKSSGGEKHVGNVEIEALRNELASQAKWEAVRIQEAVRAQLVEDKKAAAKEIAELKERHADEITRIREQEVEKSQQLVKDKTKELESRSKEEREAEVERLLQERESDLREELSVEFTGQEETKSRDRESALSKAKAEVEALTNRFDAVIAHTEHAKEASRRASGAFVLREAIGNGMPLESALQIASARSDLGMLVAQSMPAAAVRNGVPSMDSLREDFMSASKRGLSAAAVPESKAGSIWAHVLATAFSRLKVPVDLRADGGGPRSNEDRIRLAQLLVKEGDLNAAVEMLDSVDGLAKDVLADWLGAAKSHIAASRAADILLADAIITQVSLTKGD